MVYNGRIKIYWVPRLGFGKNLSEKSLPMKVYSLTSLFDFFKKFNFDFQNVIVKKVITPIFFLRKTLSAPNFFFEKNLRPPCQWFRPGYPINFDLTLTSV